MIKLVKSTFYKETLTKKALSRFVSSSDHLSFGQQCLLFEKNFSRWQKRRHCVFLNSGSSANLSIIQALLNLKELTKGAYVGFSALTWSTDVMPLIQLGLNAVPIDVELDTLNVSSRTLLAALKQFPLKMVFLTNLLGFCDDIDKITLLCKERNILLVEDTCESLGTVYKGRTLGNFGVASTFSFYVGHHMSTIEGGAVCTDNDRIATALRIVRAHGWDRNLTLKKQKRIRNHYNVNSTFYSRYTFYDLGYNLRPTDINGFIGNVQIAFLDEIIKKREKNFLEFARAIYAKEDRYHPIRFDHIDLVSNFAVPVICRTRGIHDILVERCKERIEIRPIVGGDITKQPFFQKYMKRFVDILGKSNAKLVHDQGLYFGNNPELTKREKKEIITLFTQ